MIKKYIKNNYKIYKLLSNTRERLRILYNTKTRSRYIWLLRDGDNKLTLDYPLNEESVVFDIGAYEGNFTEKINNKFRCHIFAFEPIDHSVKVLYKKFKNFPKVNIYSFGLSDKDKTVNISDIGGASSIFKRPEGQPNKSIEVRSFINFVNENEIKQIDLLYMNIEGSEYKLLNDIIDKGFIKYISHIQVQFHNFIPNAKKERKLIRKKLANTHKCNFNYPFIWERWDLKIRPGDRK